MRFFHCSPSIQQVKIQGQNEEMLLAACEQFLGKSEEQIQQVALETLEGHQRAIMGSMTVEVCTNGNSGCATHCAIRPMSRMRRAQKARRLTVLPDSCGPEWLVQYKKWQIDQTLLCTCTEKLFWLEMFNKTQSWCLRLPMRLPQIRGCLPILLLFVCIPA